MVGRKGLEPSPIARLVPKTSASTNSAIAPIKLRVLYIIGTVCPTTFLCKYNLLITRKKNNNLKKFYPFNPVNIFTLKQIKKIPIIIGKLKIIDITEKLYFFKIFKNSKVSP